MFHLTPQERFAAACLLTIFCVGTLVSIGFNQDARALQWVKTAHQAPKRQPLDLNKATAEQLEKLPGIGLKTARKIIDYRDAHGVFSSIEDLHKVKGLTNKNFDKLAPRVTINGAS